MNLDHPNKNEQRVRETLQRHEFPFDPIAWQDMQVKLAGSSTESTPVGGQSHSDNGRPPGTSSILILLLIMSTISLFSIALWFGLANPTTDTNHTAISEASKLNNNDTEIKNETETTDDLIMTELTDGKIKDDKRLTDRTNNGNIKENNRGQERTVFFNKNNSSNNAVKIIENGPGKKINYFNPMAELAGQKNITKNEQTTAAANPADIVNENSFENLEKNNDLFIDQLNSILNDEIIHEENQESSRVADLAEIDKLPLFLLEYNDSSESETLPAPPTDPVAKQWTNTDIKFGIGRGFMGTRDNSMLTFETELTNKWHRLFSASASANYGLKLSGLSENVSFFHTDLNLYYSPFGNHKTGNFKIGTGVSFLYVDDLWESGSYTDVTGMLIREFSDEKRKAFGYSIIFEHEILIGRRLLLALRARYQEYSTDSQVNLGVKFGVKL